MDSAATVPTNIQTTQLLISTAPSSVEYAQALRFVGQDISVMLAERGADGVKLELASGQVLTAKGDIPFPEGTQLQVRVSVQDGLIRLQTLEALPPSPASILGPLVQNEASGLIQQLQAPELPEALIPLAKLFSVFTLSSDQQLQQVIDSLPASTRQMLSSLLGLKENNSTLILQTLTKQFEPITSLLEMKPVFADTQLSHVFSSIGNDQKSSGAENAPPNNLRDLLLKLFESSSIKQDKTISPERIERLLESIRTELSSNSAPLSNETAKGQVSEAETVNHLEKLVQALKLLPKDVLNNISNNVMGRADADIGAIAKAILDRLIVNVKNSEVVPKDNPSGGLTAGSQRADGRTVAPRGDLPGGATAPGAGPTTALAILKANLPEDIAAGSQNAEGRTAVPKGNTSGDATAGLQNAEGRTAVPKGNTPGYATVGSQKADGHAVAPKGNPPGDAAAGSQKVDGHAVVKDNPTRGAIVPGTGATTALVAPKGNLPGDATLKPVIQELNQLIDFVAAPKENLSGDPNAKPVSQELIQLLEKMPVDVRRLIASAITGSVEAEPRAIAESLINKGIDANIKREPASKQEPAALPISRQVINSLPSEARNSISNSVLGTPGADVEAIVKAILDKIGVSAKDMVTTPEENPSADIAAKQNPQKLIQVLENLPISVRRAIASAVMGSAEAEPKAIAEFLIQKGVNSNINQNFNSKLETSPPILRQLIALLSELSIDTPTHKVAETILNGDKAVLEAAKGLLSLNEDTASASVDTKYVRPTGAKSADYSSKLFADQLSYLLRFEMLNSQSSFAPQEKNSISSWLRSIVDQLVFSKSLKSEAPEARQTANLYKSADNSSKAPASAIERAVSQDTAALAEKPQTWQAWLKGSMKALTDPMVSSKEAFFHTLAAKENVNYFELPLPWMPGRTLEMWVEADGENANKGKEKSNNRILLALTFSSLGETRIGFDTAEKRLNIKIWAEHSQPVEKELPKIEDELSALGFDAQISLHTLVANQSGAIPSIKSVINGSSLHAMG